MNQPVTVLMLSANPKGTASMRLDEERREVETGLVERSHLRDQFRLITKTAVRPRDVQRAMLDYKPQIVHFSGYGTGEDGLLLEDETGAVKPVSADALASLFGLYGDRLQCVLLNACYSTVQAEAIAHHIPYVIGMGDELGERAAIEFSVAFYDALGAGRDLEFAYKNACVAIEMAGIDQVHIPVLYRGKQGAESREPQESAKWSYSIRPSTLFSAYNPQTFTGREVEIAELSDRLHSSCRVVAIVGMTGMGKTTLAERVVAGVMEGGEVEALPYYRLSLDDRSITFDFSSSGAALLWQLGEELTLEDQQDPANLVRHILTRLQEQPCRVQIDSLERLLRGNEQEGWSEFCDPLWLDLLHQFLSATRSPSQLLLTSQDIPADLDMVASRYPQFWHCQPLQGLSSQEQHDLFRKLGLQATAQDLDYLSRIGEFYSGHPLVLQVIPKKSASRRFRATLLCTGSITQGTLRRRRGRRLTGSIAAAYFVVGCVSGLSKLWSVSLNLPVRCSAPVPFSVAPSPSSSGTRCSRMATRRWPLICCAIAT